MSASKKQYLDGLASGRKISGKSIPLPFTTDGPDKGAVHQRAGMKASDSPTIHGAPTHKKTKGR